MRIMCSPPQMLQLGVKLWHFSHASDIHLICIFRRPVSRGAKPPGQAAKPKTGLAHRVRLIKVDSYTSDIHAHLIYIPGEVAKPKTEFAHRGWFIKLASYTSGIQIHLNSYKTDQSGSKVTFIYPK